MVTGPASPKYDKEPTVSIPGTEGACVRGWDAVVATVNEAISRRSAPRTVVALECYPGVDVDEILGAIQDRETPALLLPTEQAMLDSSAIDQLTKPFLGGDDPVFGFITELNLPEFFNEQRLQELRSQIDSITSGTIYVVGSGATLVHQGDILVYADLARWEWQQRSRRNVVSNLGANNAEERPSLQYKRSYFVDWRVADRWKQSLVDRWDYYLDTNVAADPKLVTGDAVREGLQHATTRPFRVVPFFDPAPWGGQWMKEVCDLDRSVENYGWCFDCVPEENSLLLQFGDITVEMPAINLVFQHPQALLGEAVFARFGAEFPIRFDFLDTMGGGNLSFQVHPLQEYAQRHFGMNYTQDESYYLLDAKPDATVYLGLKEGVDQDALIRDLQRAQLGECEFPADRYSNQWPAKQHDHFLIPAGTVHCSGANSMVLEISATPYIFTFKLWDWGRLGLDGRPRPIHLDHGIANIDWERTTSWTEQQLVNCVQPLATGEGWREERTGLHESEFIETRRHWFTEAVSHDTAGGVNVLNLVQGSQAVVESPTDAFEPFSVNYAETFIVPAHVGPYRIRPLEQRSGEECATIKAFVRT